MLFFQKKELLSDNILFKKLEEELSNTFKIVFRDSIQGQGFTEVSHIHLLPILPMKYIENRPVILDCAIRSNYADHIIPQIFEENFIFNKKIADRNEKLKQILTNPHRESTGFVFITGYQGSGKSTFINYFIEKNINKFDFILCDFDKLMISTNMQNFNYANEGIERAILYVLLSYLEKDEKNLLSTFNLVRRHKNGLLSQNLFDSKILETLEEKLQGKNKRDQHIDLIRRLNKLNYKDVFIYFLIHLLFKPSPPLTRVIIFDNLDTISNEYLKKYFFISLDEVLWKTAPIANSDILEKNDKDFQQKFKFIFSLRDVNF